MKHYYFLIDNSVRPSKTSKYGKASICWALFENTLSPPPKRVGVFYCHSDEGPNISFYYGVITALENRFNFISNSSTIHIMGDCEPVIAQLQGTRSVDTMKYLYDQVKAIQTNYELRQGCKLIYERLDEKNLLYRGVDKIAKDAPNFFSQRIKA